jgi:asparagine synthase (glutamine-hydrolysing)
MCGITGLIDGAGVADRAPLVAMREQLRHRGPDDCGEWWSDDGRVGFGHRRLAVIDLSAAGHQPMSDDNGTTIVFNGEIYNHDDLRRELAADGHGFRSRSDTEVILKAYRSWGLECVDRLDGMFAFALMDPAAGRLFLARDRAGEKPLYFAQAGRRLVFGSELKALMAWPELRRRIDPHALDAFLAYGHVPAPLCILTGVEKLQAAHALTFDVRSGARRVWRYWSLPEEPPETTASLDDLVDEFEALLRQAVQRQLAADVPVGVLLSGGIDSSLVAAVAARVSSRPVRTFTVAVPGHQRFDEAPSARAVAAHCGTVHTELPAASLSFDLLPLLARQYDEPFGDSSSLPTYAVCRLIREHATVAIGGDGGDELFGGYPHYDWLARQEPLRRWMPGFIRRGMADLGRALPVGTRGRHHLMGLADGLAGSIAHVNLFFDAATRRSLAPVVRDITRPRAEARRAAFCRGGSLLRQASEADFSTTLADGYLVKVDRASMLSSLEVRAPLLDRAIIEFAFGRVPAQYKMSGGRLKILPRRLAARLLPSGLDDRPKQGFAVPLASWFRGPWGARMTEVLHGTDPDLLDRAMLDRLLAGQRAGYANEQRLFALAMLELWRREYGVTI